MQSVTVRYQVFKFLMYKTARLVVLSILPPGCEEFFPLTTPTQKSVLIGGRRTTVRGTTTGAGETSAMMTAGAASMMTAGAASIATRRAACLS